MSDNKRAIAQKGKVEMKRASPKRVRAISEYAALQLRRLNSKCQFRVRIKIGDDEYVGKCFDGTQQDMVFMNQAVYRSVVGEQPYTMTNAAGESIIIGTYAMVGSACRTEILSSEPY